MSLFNSVLVNSVITALVGGAVLRAEERVERREEERF